MKDIGRFALITGLIGFVLSLTGIYFSARQLFTGESFEVSAMKGDVVKILSQPLLSQQTLDNPSIEGLYNTMDIKTIQDQVDKINNSELSIEVRQELIDMKIRIGLLEKLNEQKKESYSFNFLLILSSVSAWFFSGMFAPIRDHWAQQAKVFIIRKTENNSNKSR
ncbi:MAG: hypothetical protein ACOVP4_04790 [Bacteriovoracaceae bacterium]